MKYLGLGNRISITDNRLRARNMMGGGGAGAGAGGQK